MIGETRPVVLGDEATDERARRRMRWIVGGTTIVLLVLTARAQIYDSNFVHLWEATALLAGDRPYRDFFEWGAPLAAYLSAAMQWIVGYRLIGEFLLQWSFIVAGVVLAFDLGLRQSRSPAALLAVLPLVVVILGSTPTYHYSKLFFFPLAVWLAWRYLDDPGSARAAAMGTATAIAFLFRHDYVVYLGFVSALAIALGRIVLPWSRSLPAFIREGGVAALTAAAIVAPWAVMVQRSEGLPAYTALRAAKFEGSWYEPYRTLLALNPVRELLPPPPAPALQAEVAFVWQHDVSAAQQRQLEARHGLTRLESADAAGRTRYRVANINDQGLLPLDSFIHDAVGFPWDALRDARVRLPARANVELWIQQVSLLVPLCLVLAGILGLWRGRGSRLATSAAWRTLVAAIFLVVVDTALFRQPSYFTTVAPMTAALGASVLAPSPLPSARLWSLTRRGIAIAVVVTTMFAAIVWARRDLLFRPWDIPGSVAVAFDAMLAAPPASAASVKPAYRYLHECSGEADRLLITGSTPFDASYYARRGVAGGHLYWHSAWASDPAHEQASLDLLRRQSVPIAFSTHDPVLSDLAAYPSVRDYVAAHYREVEGTGGTVMVDTRREPVRRFGERGWPCFR